MSDRARTGTGGVIGALVLDAALVIVFAVIGRSSHAEGLDVAGRLGHGVAVPRGPRDRLGWRRGRGGIRSHRGRPA